jgi:hypothetical protein
MVLPESLLEGTAGNGFVHWPLLSIARGGLIGDAGGLIGHTGGIGWRTGVVDRLLLGLLGRGDKRRIGLYCSSQHTGSPSTS